MTLTEEFVWGRTMFHSHPHLLLFITMLCLKERGSEGFPVRTRSLAFERLLSLVS